MSPQEITKLQIEIENHLGKKIMEGLEAYYSCKNIVIGNTLSLMEMIEFAEHPNGPVQITAYDQRANLKPVFDEAGRHLHNFLSSITTFIDHTRNLMNENYINPQHRGEYQKSIEFLFKNDPLTQFLKKLRNYITHRELPFASISINLADSSASREFCIDGTKLKDWKNWCAPSRAFIETRGPQIRVRSVVKDCELKTSEFHTNFIGAFKRFYGDEVDQVRALMEKLNAAVKASF